MTSRLPKSYRIGFMGMELSPKASWIHLKLNTANPGREKFDVLTMQFPLAPSSATLQSRIMPLVIERSRHGIGPTAFDLSSARP